MVRQLIAHRPMIKAATFALSRAVRDLDPAALPTIANCRTASAVTRLPNDPGRGLGHNATRRTAD